jgi:hypothetical protein
VQTVEAWVRAGAPEGQRLHAVRARLETTGWKLWGKPDPAHRNSGRLTVPVGPVATYAFLIVPLHFDHDVWVRAAVVFRLTSGRVILPPSRCAGASAGVEFSDGFSAQ